MSRKAFNQIAAGLDELLTAISQDWRYVVKAERGEMGLLDYLVVDVEKDETVCICFTERAAEVICDHLNDTSFEND